eukprot:5052419-Amphidinium_carterae.1
MSPSTAVLEQALQTAHATASFSSGQTVDVADHSALDVDAKVAENQVKQKIEDQPQQTAEEQPGKSRRKNKTKHIVGDSAKQWFIEFKNAMHAQRGWGPLQ